MEDKIIKSDTQIVSPTEKNEIANIVKEIANSILESVQ
jgi:hypothetical protein